MALAAKIRYLVMNRTNEVIAPRDEEVEGFNAADLKAAGEIPKKFSPSFQNEGTAKRFACALAAKYPGERFYVAKVLGGAVVEPQLGAWSDASSGVLHDTELAPDEMDDGTPNE